MAEPRPRTPAQIQSEEKRKLRFKSFSIKISNEFYAQVVEAAHKSKRSIHGFIVDAIAQAVNKINGEK